MTPDELLTDAFENLTEEDQSVAILQMLRETLEHDGHVGDAADLDAAILTNGEEILSALAKKGASE